MVQKKRTHDPLCLEHAHYPPRTCSQTRSQNLKDRRDLWPFSSLSLSPYRYDLALFLCRFCLFVNCNVASPAYIREEELTGFAPPPYTPSRSLPILPRVSFPESRPFSLDSLFFLLFSSSSSTFFHASVHVGRNQAWKEGVRRGEKWRGLWNRGLFSRNSFESREACTFDHGAATWAWAKSAVNFFGDFFGTLDLSGLEILKFFHPVRCFVVKYFYEVFSFMRGNRRCLFGCAYVCMRGLLTMEFFLFFPFSIRRKVRSASLHFLRPLCKSFFLGNKRRGGGCCIFGRDLETNLWIGWNRNRRDKIK